MRSIARSVITYEFPNERFTSSWLVNIRVMTFENFKAMIECDRPEALPVGLVAQVKPTPWVLRAGHGKDARIRMVIAGEHRYEREPGGDVWRRVERSEFDVLDDAA